MATNLKYSARCTVEHAIIQMATIFFGGRFYHSSRGFIVCLHDIDRPTKSQVDINHLRLYLKGPKLNATQTTLYNLLYKGVAIAAPKVTKEDIHTGSFILKVPTYLLILK